ncbi:GNAT family N-acetyltransferase [Mucilaginibacter hurinus]|uniref:GNAT family N-acetyltransferase n=1 Tax=Mucilaginibacter hurinus TaxID=2201324 RepID=A0A367GKL2_9SPHI|nr:GNAT family N-acetyltransferase [Mucilaginibacter hurinus]RCH54017.1 GNAT family N-acetyltransferase [Mucilaginibacter hurinus]
MHAAPKIQVNKASSDKDLQAVFSIRRTVFVDEQNCPPELEWGFEDESTHFLAMAEGEPAGAARWRKTANGYKLERFAVLKRYRGKGVAQALVQAVLNDLPADADYIYLNAQIPAIRLYAKFGFKQTGPQFDEAGIQHYKMVSEK